MNTPICDFVRDYAAKDPLRLHMPGHKGVGPLGVEALDVTELPGADVLYTPKGIIAESEANAAALYGSAATVYSTEGSSLCIRAMLYLAQLWAKASERRPLVLAGRNAHKTFLSAAALLDFDVEWLSAAGGSLLACPIPPEALEQRLSAMAEPPTAVYITSPDYLGNQAPLAALAEVSHAHGALLLVDNAHGAYLKFMSTSQHPLDLGADLCCDSAHKTLPVLTGGAYLHISKSAPSMLRGAANRAMALFASTSPSYLILQSLDAANAVLAGDFPARVTAAADALAALRSELAADDWAPVDGEPLKLTLCPKARGWAGEEIEAILVRQGIFAEFADSDNIVFMSTPGIDPARLSALNRALRAIPRREAIRTAPPQLGAPLRILTPREAMLAPAETLPVNAAVGRVLASPGVSCPPAVPILVCGERIDGAAVTAFRYYGVERVEVVREEIVPVDKTNLSLAGTVHAAAWQASHEPFCAPDFVAAHTPERQTDYLRRKLESGSQLWLLLADRPIGVVSVTGGLIEDLYVLPERQNRGFGTKLLRHAIRRCEGAPTLWILENNIGAARLYERLGFVPTGRRSNISGGLDEVEYRLT